jgi:hypothetical protein
MYRQTGRYATTADAASVWDVYTSVKAWPLWSQDIQRATLEGPFVAGRSGRVKFARVPEGRFDITELDESAGVFTIVARLFGGLLRVTFFHELTAIPSGTQITESADFGGLLAPILGFIERRRLRRQWPHAMRAMTAMACEREAAPAGR